mmetsp:Transcript_5062/g.10269  ORF Transcript_5062/g.10269 Transcript_5062/m.10269 type:complete len:463 (-) Transcript_5062:288-1676(-)
MLRKDHCESGLSGDTLLLWTLPGSLMHGRRPMLRSLCGLMGGPTKAGIARVHPRICVIGAGFGGFYTALSLLESRLPPLSRPDITLLDRNNRFVFLPMLYETLNGDVDEWEIAPKVEDLLDLPRRHVRFQQAEVDGLDLSGKNVHVLTRETSTGVIRQQSIPYDKLVIALGSVPILDLVPGAMEHAFPFATLDHAKRLKNELDRIKRSRTRGISVVVVGGGYSGVEVACAVAEKLSSQAKVTILSRGQVLESSTPHNRETGIEALKKLDVDMREGLTVSRVESQAVECFTIQGNAHEKISANLIVWTAGIAQNPLLSKLGLPLLDNGRLKVTDSLQVVDYPDIYALGDCAGYKDNRGFEAASTAQQAMQQANAVSNSLQAEILGGRPRPYRYQHLGEMLVLGRSNASVDGLGGVRLQGIEALVARRAAYLARMPTPRHRVKVAARWATQPVETIWGEDVFSL